MIIISFVGFVGYCILGDDRNHIDYTPLPHYNNQTGEVHIMDSDSDEDGALYDSKVVEI